MRLFISAVFLFCGFSCFGQITSPLEFWEGVDYDLGKIKGNLSSVELKEYTAIDYFGELKKQSTKLDAVLIFNSKNHLIKAEGLVDGKKGILNIQYNIDSFLVEIRTNGFFGEEKYNYRAVWRYDNRGNIIEYTLYKNDTIQAKEFAKYNEKNKPIEHKVYDATGKLFYQINNLYDKNGNEIEYTWKSDYYSKKEKYTYNPYNLLIEKQEFDENDKIEKIYRYKYDVAGKLIEENYSYKGVPKSKIIITYNSKGEKTESVKYGENGNILVKETFLYHPNGKMPEERIIIYDDDTREEEWSVIERYNTEGALIERISTTNYDSKSKKTVSTYENDSRGNWIKKTEYSVSPPTALPSQYTITERKINYR
jgi:hypothetical protein